MPYVPPPTARFGLRMTDDDSGTPDDITYSEFQIFFDNVTVLAAETTTWNECSDGTAVTDPADKYKVFAAYFFEHFRPWLYYKSQSEERPGELIIFPEDAEIDDITLPYAADGAWYDLDNNVSWMVPGRTYTVEHVEWAFEVYLVPADIPDPAA